MFNTISILSIRTRLGLTVGLLSLLLIGIGASGLYGQAQVNAALKSVYDTRVLALGHLNNVARELLRAQFQLVISNAADAPGPQADAIEQVLASEQQQWRRYTAIALTAEETAQAQQFAARRAAFVEQTIEPALAALRGDHWDQAMQLIRGPMLEQYPALRQQLDDLIQLQMRAARQQYEQSQADYAARRALAIALIGIGVALAALAGWRLMRAISGPLENAVRVAQSVSSGDLSRDISVGSQDEVGVMLTALRAMNDGLQHIVGKVRSGTDTIAAASSRIAAGNLDLSSRTDEQAYSLQETASSMEQLTATVRQNADHARQANHLALAASAVARQGGGVVGQVVMTMNSIKASSSQIADIVSVIDGIAFQTNILALNAAVEAARAGEQGRGFAVVAAEVRNLAQRSAGAAKQIAALIGNSVQQVDSGSRLVQQAGTTMEHIVNSVQRVTDIIGDISTASAEQTRGIEHINEAIAQMEAVTHENAGLVEQSAAAAQSLQDQAAALLETVGVFKLSGRLGAAARRRKPAGAYLFSEQPA